MQKQAVVMRKIEINNTNYVQSPLRVIVDDGQTHKCTFCCMFLLLCSSVCTQEVLFTPH